MNDRVRNALYHAWSQTPEGKENERTYNAGYYRSHRNKIIQNVLERRKRRKETGVSSFDSIINTLDAAYSYRLAKSKSPIDYRKGGEKVYDIVHSIVSIGKKVIPLLSLNKTVKEASNFYKEGFDWLKKYW